MEGIVGSLAQCLSHVACRHCNILLGYCRVHLGGRYSAYAHSLGVEPHAHRVFSCAHYIHSTYSWGACQLVDKLQLRVVRQIELVVDGVARESDEQHNVRRLLLHCHSLLYNLARQAVHSNVHPVLYKHGCHINVCSHLKGHCQLIAARRGGG